MKSRGHGCRLARKCEEAIAALLSQPTLKAAAKKVGVSERALRKWMKIPEFDNLLREARSQVFTHALSRLQAVASEAVAVLERAMKRQKSNDTARTRAAAVVLTNALKGGVLDDLAERVAELESRGKPQ